MKGDSTVAETEESNVGQSKCSRLVVFVQVGSVGMMFGVLAPFRLAEAGKQAAGEEVKKGGEEFVVCRPRRFM